MFKVNNKDTRVRLLTNLIILEKRKDRREKIPSIIEDLLFLLLSLPSIKSNFK